jgi:chromosomal replication initiator protein
VALLSVERGLRLTAESGTKIWEQALGSLRSEVDEENFETWLSTARFRALEDDTLHLDVPSAFNQAWLTRNFREQISAAVERIAERHIDLDFHVTPVIDDDIEEVRTVPRSTGKLASVPVVVPPLDAVGLNHALSFERFVVGESNRFAHAACRAVAEPETEAWNPLLIWGGVGLGKTHLLHATGQEFLKRSPGARVRYVNAERFMNDYILAIRHGRITDFRDIYRSVDLLLLDDVQFIFGKEGTQNEFFHTFNDLHNRCKKIVLSCDRPPSEMSNIEERLRSRFEWGLIVDVQAPDLETRIAILHQKSALHGFHLDAEVALFIAERIKTNIRKLEGVLTSLRHHSRLTDKPISMESVQQVLGHFLVSEEPQRVTVERIQSSTCDYFSIRHSELVGRERHKKITLPRHLAMYLCRLLTDLSFPEIALRFGGRNHTSILHAFRKIEKELLKNSDLQNLTNYLAKKIQEGSE